MIRFTSLAIGFAALCLSFGASAHVPNSASLTDDGIIHTNLADDGIIHTNLSLTDDGIIHTN
jgi:hypothetical protein